MDGGDAENGLGEEGVSFLPDKKTKDENTCNDCMGPLLTREDLLKLDSEEPIWRRVRLILMVLFWVLWVGLLAASIIIIVLTPKCPPIPKLEFWQSKVGYWVDPFSFKDSGNDMTGDFKGLVEKLDYIKETVGAGFVILGSFTSGFYTNPKQTLGLTDNFTSVDPALGTLEQFGSLVKTYHRSGMEVVITLDVNSVSLSHPWASNPALIQPAGPASMSVVEFWLKHGVDGILLSNAAFYVEGNGQPSGNSKVAITDTNKWFGKYPANQLFTNGSVEFVKKIREVVDAVSSKTSRHRKTIPQPDTWMTPSIQSYASSSADEKPFVALATATPSDQHHDDVISLATTFLLPGTPLVYYGSELGIVFKPTITPPTKFYPGGKAPFPNLTPRDSGLTCHLPMPWDRSGLGFSAASDNSTFPQYLNTFGISETVESALAIGRGDTALQMVQQLIKLRKKPSLLWGDFQTFEPSVTVNKKGVEIFVRKAIGYPAFVVVFIKNTPNYADVFDFSTLCGQVITRFTHPLRPAMGLDKAVDSSRLYLKTEQQPAIYVFECAAAQSA